MSRVVWKIFIMMVDRSFEEPPNIHQPDQHGLHCDLSQVNNQYNDQHA